MTFEKWVRERFINNVRIDTNMKWAYDKVENPTEVPIWYERRMWVHNVIRETTTSRTISTS